MDNVAAVSQGNCVQRNLVPEESTYVRKAMQKAAETASGDSWCSRFLSIACATAAVALSFFNTFTYLAVTACRVLVNLTKFEFADALYILGLGIFDSTRSFILGTLGIVYVAIGAFFPETIYGVFSPSTLPPTIVEQLRTQIAKLDGQIKQLTEEKERLSEHQSNRGSEREQATNAGLLQVREETIIHLQAKVTTLEEKLRTLQQQPPAPQPDVQTQDGQVVQSPSRESLEMEKEFLRNEIAKLRTQLFQNSQADGRIKELEEELEVTKDAMIAAQEAYADLRSQPANSQTQESALKLQAEISTRDTLIQGLNAEKGKLERKIDIFKQALEKVKVEKAELEANNTKNNNAKLAKENEELSKELEQVNLEVKTVQKELVILRKLDESHKKEEQIQSGLIEQLNNQVQAMREALKKSPDAQVVDLTNQIEKLNKQVDTVSQAARNAMKEERTARYRSLGNITRPQLAAIAASKTQQAASQQATVQAPRVAPVASNSNTNNSAAQTPPQKRKPPVGAVQLPSMTPTAGAPLQKPLPTPVRRSEVTNEEAVSSSAELMRAFEHIDGYSTSLSDAEFVTVSDTQLKDGQDLDQRLYGEHPKEQLGAIPPDQRAQKLMAYWVYLQDKYARSNQQNSRGRSIVDQDQHFLNFLLGIPSIKKINVGVDTATEASSFKGRTVKANYQLDIYDASLRKGFTVVIKPIFQDSGTHRQQYTEIEVIEKDLWQRAVDIGLKLLRKPAKVLLTPELQKPIHDAFVRVLEVTGEKEIPHRVIEQGIFGIIAYVSTLLEKYPFDNNNQINAVEELYHAIWSSGNYPWARRSENPLAGGSKLPRFYDQMAFMRWMHIVNFKRARTQEEALRALSMIQSLSHEDVTPDTTIAASQRETHKGKESGLRIQLGKDFTRVKDNTGKVIAKYIVDGEPLAAETSLEDFEKLLLNGRWLEGKDEQEKKTRVLEVLSYFEQGLKSSILQEVYWVVNKQDVSCLDPQMQNNNAVAGKPMGQASLQQKVRSENDGSIVTYDMQTGPDFKLRFSNHLDVVMPTPEGPSDRIILGVVKVELQISITDKGTTSFYRWDVVKVNDGKEVTIATQQS